MKDKFVLGLVVGFVITIALVASYAMGQTAHPDVYAENGVKICDSSIAFPAFESKGMLQESADGVTWHDVIPLERSKFWRVVTK